MAEFFTQKSNCAKSLVVALVLFLASSAAAQSQDSNAPIIKGIYLRKREDLILRVEARSPNDDEGTYRLSFGGSFEPVVGGPDIAETETPATEAPVTGRKTKRVNSVGATVEEPAPPA